MNYLLPLQRRDADALLGEHRHGRRRRRCSSACRAPARRRCRAIPSAQLIGDDEHGWSDRGVFNFEGGCYAKMIKLSAEAEPQIYATTRRFGTVLENVSIDAVTRRLDLDDDALTENTRGAYPIGFIDNSVPSGVGGHPQQHRDADGRRLRRAAADREADARRRRCTTSCPATRRRWRAPRRASPSRSATFSTCFGAPFLPLQPERLREAARRDASHAHNVERVAGEHGVDRRAVRRRVSA